MVIDIIKQLDVDDNNKIETKDLEKSLESGFFDNKENCKKLKEALENDKQSDEVIDNYFESAVNNITSNHKDSYENNKRYWNYSPKEVKTIQIWANLTQDANLVVDGNRGVNQWVESNTNPYIWRKELSWEFPNIENMISGLPKNQQMQVVKEFYKTYGQVKISGRFFLDKLSKQTQNMDLIDLKEMLLIGIINKKIEGGELDDTKELVDKVSDIILSYHGDTLKQFQHKKLLNMQKRVQDLNNLIEKTEDNEKSKSLKVEKYKTMLEMAKTTSNNKLRELVYTQISNDFQENEITSIFGEGVNNKIEQTREKISQKLGEHDKINDILTQLEAPGKLQFHRATWDEYSKIWPDDANANRRGTRGTLGDYKRNIGQSREFKNKDNYVPQDIFKISVPGTQPIIVRIQNDGPIDLADKLKKVQAFVRKYKKVVIPKYTSYQSGKSMYAGYDYYRQDKNELSKNVIDVNDFYASGKDKNGNIILLSHNKKKQIIDSQKVEESNFYGDLAKMSVNTPEYNKASGFVQNISGKMGRTQELYKKMQDGKINWGGINYGQLLGSLSLPGIFSLNQAIPIEGGLSDIEAKEAWRYCEETKDQINNLKSKKGDLLELKKSLSALLDYTDKNGIKSSEELAIKDAIKGVDFLLSGINGGFDPFLDFMSNAKNLSSNDSFYEKFGRWFRDNGLKTLLAIGTAVGVMLVPFSGGTSLLGVAALTTVGGMVGHRVGQYLNEGLQNKAFKKEITLSDGTKRVIRYDDPTDVEMLKNGELEFDDFVKNVGIEFVMGTASVYGFMKAGQIVGSSIGKYALKNPASKVTKIIKKIKPKFGNLDDAYTQRLFNSVAENQGFFNKFGKEFLDELKEEGMESGAEALAEKSGIPGLAMLVTMWNCLTPNMANPKVFPQNEISVSQMRKIENQSILELDYNPNAENFNMDAILDHFTSQGFVLQENGTLTKKAEALENVEQVVVLKPSQEPHSVRELNITNKYPNLKYDGEASKYDISNLTKEEFISLKKSLKKYFVISPKEEGGFWAANANTSIEFVGEIENKIESKIDIREKEIQFDGDYSSHINNKLSIEKAQIPLRDGKHEYKIFDKEGNSIDWNSMSEIQQKELMIEGYKKSLHQDVVILGDINYVNKTGYAFSKDTKLPGDIDYAVENNADKVGVLLDKLLDGQTKGKIQNLKLTHKLQQDFVIYDFSEGRMSPEKRDAVNSMIENKELRIEYDGLVEIEGSDKKISINREIFMEDGNGVFEIDVNKSQKVDINGVEVNFLTPEGYTSYVEDLLVTDLSKEFGDTEKKLKVAKRIDDYLDALSIKDNSKKTVLDRLKELIFGRKLSKTQTQRMLDSIKESDRYTDEKHPLHKQYVDAVNHFEVVIKAQVEYRNIGGKKFEMDRNVVINRASDIKKRIKMYKQGNNNESLVRLKSDVEMLTRQLKSFDLNTDAGFFAFHELYLLTETDAYDLSNIQEIKKEPKPTEIKRNVEMKERFDVKRDSDVVIFGDQHGKYKYFVRNLEESGIAKVGEDGKLIWTGGDSKVQFLGDILADRGTGGFKIFEAIIELRKQAQLEGGDILRTIDGNHEDKIKAYMIGDFSDMKSLSIKSNQGAFYDILCNMFPSPAFKALLDVGYSSKSERNDHIAQFLMDYNITDTQDQQMLYDFTKLRPREIIQQSIPIIKKYGLIPAEHMEVFDKFEQFMESDKGNQKDPVSKFLEEYQPLMMKYMREYKSELLKELTQGTVIQYSDDNLFLHSKPSKEILLALQKYSEQFGGDLAKTVDYVNGIYQKGLAIKMGIEIDENFDMKVFDDIRSIFLNDDNRGLTADTQHYEWLKATGVNTIVHGHTSGDANYYASLDAGIKVVDADRSSGKKKDDPTSIVKVNKVGEIEVSGDKLVTLKRWMTDQEILDQYGGKDAILDKNSAKLDKNNLNEVVGYVDKDTGMLITNKEKYKNLSLKEKKLYILHERAHQVFWKLNAVGKLGGLVSSFENHLQFGEMKQYLAEQGYTLNSNADVVNELISLYSEKVYQGIELTPLEQEMRALVRKSGILAFQFAEKGDIQAMRKFFDAEVEDSEKMQGYQFIVASAAKIDSVVAAGG